MTTIRFGKCERNVIRNLSAACYLRKAVFVNRRTDMNANCYAYITYQVVVLPPPLLPLLFQRGVHLRAMLGDALLEVLHALLQGELEDLVVLREIYFLKNICNSITNKY